ncbi:hypothetical protein PBOI14_60280 [Pseudomonas sp. Boi14]|nr:hypothetical protein PBOI14_60280 [Pseudomonas sp. Boi14]
MSTETLLKTPLHSLHLELGARMVPFAGYDMPVQYPLGVMKEHQHTREQAGLFDVSHMGQILLRGANAAQALETLVPVDIIDLPVGMQRYAMFINEQGGILDDLMVANLGTNSCSWWSTPPARTRTWPTCAATWASNATFNRCSRNGPCWPCKARLRSRCWRAWRRRWRR